MQQEDALNAIKAHHELGMAKHPSWTNAKQAMGRISHRFQLLIQANDNARAPHYFDHVARRALQLAGLCVRLVVDLDLEQGAPAPKDT